MIHAIEEPPESLYEVLGVAGTAVAGPNLDDARSGHWTRLAFELPEGALDVYTEHMRQIAQFDIDNLPKDSPAAAVRYVVLGNVLVEPLILALR